MFLSRRRGGMAATVAAVIVTAGLLSGCGGSSGKGGGGTGTGMGSGATQAPSSPATTNYFPSATATAEPTSMVKLSFPELWAADGCLYRYVAVNDQIVNGTDQPLAYCRQVNPNDNVAGHTGYLVYLRGDGPNNWFLATNTTYPGYFQWQTPTEQLWHACVPSNCAATESVKYEGQYISLGDYLAQTNADTISAEATAEVRATTQERLDLTNAKVALEQQQASSEQARQALAAQQQALANQQQALAAQQARAVQLQRPSHGGYSAAEARGMMADSRIRIQAYQNLPDCSSAPFGCGPYI